ncbi:transposase [Streptomyces sp. NPDC058200]|uniref:transposase n=1 Tax=Streptomyces sp. NPDC058200 TaxID=3346378 RepID=UPI0036E2EC6D
MIALHAGIGGPLGVLRIRYGERLLEAGVTASVGSVADSYDNAMAEALNGSFKAEPIEHQGPWRDADQVERAVVQWVGWYNTERLHSALDDLPPEEFEAQHYRSQMTTTTASNHTNRPLRNPGQLRRWVGSRACAEKPRRLASVLVVVATPQFKGCDGLRDSQGTQGSGAPEAPG